MLGDCGTGGRLRAGELTIWYSSRCPACLSCWRSNAFHESGHPVELILNRLNEFELVGTVAPWRHADPLFEGTVERVDRSEAAPIGNFVLAKE